MQNFDLSHHIPAHWQQEWLSPFFASPSNSHKKNSATHSVTLSRNSKHQFQYQIPIKMDFEYQSQGRDQYTSIKFQILNNQENNNIHVATECIMDIKEQVWSLLESKILQSTPLLPPKKLVLSLDGAQRMIFCFEDTFVTIKFPFNLYQHWCIVTAHAQPYSHYAITMEMESAEYYSPQAEWAIVDETETRLENTDEDLLLWSHKDAARCVLYPSMPSNTYKSG